MSTQEIAKRLAELCSKGEFEAAQKELYASDAVSIEPRATPEFPKETKGLKAIIEKGHKWAAGIEQMHSCSVSQPLVAGNSFALTMNLDITAKGQGRMQLQEVCVYQIQNDKITSEQFFM